MMAAWSALSMMILVTLIGLLVIQMALWSTLGALRRLPI